MSMVQPKQGIRASSLPPLTKVAQNSGDWHTVLQEGLPVVVKRISFLKKAPKWTWDVEFLIKHADAEALFAVFAGKGCMMAERPCEASSTQACSHESSAKKIFVTAGQLKKLKLLEKRRNRYMLQDILKVGLGKSLEKEFACFMWDVVDDIRKVAGYGQVISHELNIFEEGCYCPARYEEQDTIHAAMTGKRRVMVFAPEAYASMYPYPVCHPADRYTQLGEHLENGTYPGDQYPRFPFAAKYGQVVDLNPGEVLFLPSHWWIHDMAPSAEAISMTLWCKPKKDEDTAMHTNPAARMVTVRRNVEKILAEKLGAVTAHIVWCCLERGRVPHGQDVDELNTMLYDAQRLLTHLIDGRKAKLLLKEIADGRFLSQPVSHPKLVDFKARIAEEDEAERRDIARRAACAAFRQKRELQSEPAQQAD
eukprot:TRINITY_DN11633_c0_g1_i1.p1 TRINITY_DN11633_c0_g1~~TRINITY_DN11633_c0_g1_i1.p1  ORF type:complete len:422 (+),score=148.15 TRINITY_DN11633_c0_g1_i1:68-1333(+)